MIAAAPIPPSLPFEPAKIFPFGGERCPARNECARGRLVSLDPYRTSDREPAEPVACPSPIRLRSEHIDPETGEIVSQGEGVLLDCDTWGCAVCGPRRRVRLVGHYSSRLGPVPSLYLVTLTLDPASGVTPAESRKYAVHLWSLWRKRMHRAATKAGHIDGVRFVAAVEWQTGTGLAHIHAIASLPGISPDDAAAAWSSIGGGIVCDVQPITARTPGGSDDDGPRGSAARSVGYVLKYALKEATERPVRGRRYLLASQGLGYYSAPARAARRSHVEARTGVALPAAGAPRPVPGTDLVEVLVPTVTRPAGLSPDTITDDDRARWAVLRAANRRTSYRYLDQKSGRWWRIEQRGEARTRTQIPPPSRWAPRASV